VTLVNTNGLVLFGPGSEWLWSFLSDVAVVVTLVGLYLQLRAARTTRVFEQTTAIRAEWASRSERQNRLVALIDLEGRPVEAGLPPAAYTVCNWFARLGYFIRQGHVELEQVSAIFANDILWWWTTCQPYIQRDRDRLAIPQILADFEHLAAQQQVAWRSETGTEFSPYESIAEQIDSYIDLLNQHLDVERGVIPERRTPVAVNHADDERGVPPD
jgi:hypothetical protein